MKTDALFYELFQAAPQIFFALLQITPACPYRFESITVKTTEKRIDDVLEPEEEGQPIYFLEVQAFPDKGIYWRAMREIATYFEQRPARQKDEWQAVVLWLNKEDDPGFGTLKLLGRKPKPRLVSSDLLTLLKKLDKSSLALNVLRPLLIEDESEVKQNVAEWAEKIRQTPNLDLNTEDKLVSVMSQLSEQKFRTFSYEELSQMLRLTPLSETTSGQELLKDYTIETLTDQVQLKFSPSVQKMEDVVENLQLMELEGLKVLFREIIRIEPFEELEAWFHDHLPAKELA